MNALIVDSGPRIATYAPDDTHHARCVQLWALLGELFSKCRHMTGTPLTPAVAQELSAVYLVNGALATTAIEANTLSKQKARAIYEGRTQLPPSQRYLQQEIENALAALQESGARS